MRVKLLLFFIAIFYSICNYAQTAEDIVAAAKANMQEEVLVHADKHTYYLGETVWLKLYFYHPSGPNIKGTAVKTDLLNENGEIVASKITPIAENYSLVNFTLDKSIAAGRYFIRSYTRLMQASVPQAVSYKIIEVMEPGTVNNNPGQVILNTGIEGGSLVHGCVTGIAISSKDQHNRPVSVPCFLLSGDGDTLADLRTSQNGLGKISLFPEYGRRYFVIAVSPGGGIIKQALPDVVRYGVNLRVADNEKGKQLLIKVSDDAAHPVKPAKIIGIINNSVAFDIPVPENSKELQKIIPTKTLPSGILNIVVLDAAQNELASRACFVNNEEYKGTAKLSALSTSVERRGKSEFMITPVDSGFLNASVSVVTGESAGTDGLASQLLLYNQLTLPVYDGNTFLVNNETSKKELDQLVLSHGYKWKWDVLRQLGAMRLPAADDVFFTVTGMMTKKDKPLTETDINFIAKQKDSIVSVFNAATDKAGKISLEGLLFQDSLTLYFQPNKARGTNLKWNISSLPLEKQFQLPVDMAMIQKLRSPGYDAVAVKKPSIAYTEMELSDTAGTLPGVIVKSYRDKRREVEQRYISSSLGSMSRATIDFINDPPHSSLNLFEYLRGRYSYLTVLGGVGRGEYMVVMRGAMSLGTGQIGMALYLDDFPVTASQIATIPVTQIALVKVYSSGPLVGVGGALAVYTRKGEDRLNESSYTNLQKVTLKGFSAIKDFISPDYGNMKGTQVKKDNRLTLYWNPDLLLDSAYRFIFYNSDVSRKYKIVVQGITADGKFVYEEKMITP